MSLLSQRLTQLRKQAGQQVLKAQKLSSEQALAERLQHTRVGSYQTSSKKIADDELARLLNGKVLSEGLIHIVNETPLNALHNSYDASTLPVQLQVWPEAVCDDIGSLLFVDTETTGLSSGAGTIVFLLGVAEIVDHTVVSQQLLLNGLHGEMAMLEWFNRKLQSNKTLVSYNGKSFDLPLLVSRYRLKRLASPLLTLSHIDLVHWVRRMYQTYWPDCRLQSAEQFCINFVRVNDMPGSEAPAIFSELIREGKADRLQALCQHHHWDVLSLIALLDHVAKCVGSSTNVHFDVYKTANHLFKQKQTIAARQLLERNKNRLCVKGNYLLAWIYRREQRWQEALEILIGLETENYLPAMETLAKYFEHKQKNFNTALVYAKRLYQQEQIACHAKRINRLKNKIHSGT